MSRRRRQAEFLFVQIFNVGAGRILVFEFSFSTLASGTNFVTLGSIVLKRDRPQNVLETCIPYGGQSENESESGAVVYVSS